MILNLSKKDLIRRLHIIKNNRVFKGLDAFLIVWGEIPRYKILAKFASIPVIYHLAWLIYEFIALILFYKNRHLLKMNNNFEILEKIVLSILLVCTLIVIGQEILMMVENQRVTLADILLLFIYVEVLGMIKEYWVAKVIRMSYPLFIAMTALARLIILQRKDIEPVTLIYDLYQS